MQYFKSTDPSKMDREEKSILQKEIQKAIDRGQPFTKVKTGQFGQTLKIETCRLGEYSL